MRRGRVSGDHPHAVFHGDPEVVQLVGVFAGRIGDRAALLDEVGQQEAAAEEAAPGRGRNVETG